MDQVAYLYWLGRMWRHAMRGMPRGSINASTNPYLVPAFFSPASNVSCTAGTETTVLTTTTALVGTPGMNYIPMVQGLLVFLMGATASVSLVIAARYAGGSDFTQTQTVDTGLLVANATIAIPVFLVGANARANASGQINANAIQVTALAGTTACTCRQTASVLGIFLEPGPDA